MIKNNRILIVDDNESVRKDFEKILCPKKKQDLSGTEAILFDDFQQEPGEQENQQTYELDFATQAEQAYTKVVEAEQDNKPYAFVFTDVIMPPGMDGVSLTRKIWKRFPETEVVIVTAHADYSWEDIVGQLGESSRLIVIKKPFDRITIKQLALTLTEKKAAEAELKRHRDHLAAEVERRTRDLVRANRDMAMQKELLESINRHYLTLFERNEVAIWYEDFSMVQRELDHLSRTGVTDLAAYMEEHPEVLARLAESVTLRDVNEATLRMFRAQSSKSFLNELGKRMHLDRVETFLLELLAIWEGETDFRTELELNTPEGPMYLVLSISIPRTAEEFSKVPISIRDVTKQKRAEKILQFQAYYDDLTKLPNKKLFNERLQQALEEAGEAKFGNRSTDGGDSAHSGLVAVIFIDLDGFKAVNDNLGHHAGDILLKQVGDRLRACVKRRWDTVARLGGDEFVVILPNLGQAFHAETVGRRILKELNRPFDLELSNRSGREVVSASISGSIGIAVYPDDGNIPMELVEKADTAMYKAKNAGKNGLCFFTPEMEGEALRRRDLEQSLERAFSAGELCLFYQPIVTMESGTIVGFEALLRWKHSSGLILPEEFLGIAEDTGLIVEIDRWVLAEVGRTMAAWNFSTGFININISNRTSRTTGFAQLVQRSLAPFEVPPHRIVLDIQESVFLKSKDQLRSELVEVKKLGYRLGLDDFGYGHASLAQLFEIGFHMVKFPVDLLEREERLGLALATAAGVMGIETIAEGVETAEQRQSFQELGCKHYQGFLFSEPLPADRIPLLMGEEILEKGPSKA